MVLKEQLVALSDSRYKAFHSKLMPTVSPDKILGIRTPVLRRFAKEFFKSDDAVNFMREIPHEYYEEDNLHGMLIEQIKDFDEVIRQLDIFLPYVDNWATCDITSPKVFKNHLAELYVKIKEWLFSGHTYTIRFAIKTLMGLYLDEHFQAEHLVLISDVKSDQYYVNMAIAWYFATALAKQYNAALPYLKNRKLETWTHNKAIQKSLESFRISSEQKEYLRKLKIR